VNARERVNRWGLYVVCLVCGAEERHRPEKDGRLRERRSSCHTSRMRSRRWTLDYPNRARGEHLDALNQRKLWD
jgi:hypothetical protein